MSGLARSSQSRELSPRDSRVDELEAYADKNGYLTHTNHGPVRERQGRDQPSKEPQDWRVIAFLSALAAIVVLLVVIATAVVVGQSNGSDAETNKALIGLVETLVEQNQEAEARRSEKRAKSAAIKLSPWQQQILFTIVACLAAIGLGWAFAGKGGAALVFCAVLAAVGMTSGIF